MQTCLEKRGIDERNAEIVRSDYNKDNEYSATHKDALSDGDPQGKGSGHGGHSHWLPDCTKPTTLFNYSNFDTSPDMQIGGLYDIEGRNGISGRKRAMSSSLYNDKNQYGAHLIDTSLNRNDGQYQIP
jgi:hypothetical protein